MEKAIVFPSKDHVEIQPYTPPALEAGELLVRTEYSGVSQGTEIWALTDRRPELKFPTIPGYQSVGIIEQIGAGVTGYAVGQRVLFHSSRIPAKWPETWMAGHVSLAVTRVASNPPPRVLPEGVDPVAASLAAMVGVALRGNDMLEIRPGDLAVVMGQGLIGQAAAQLARLRGAIVIATDLAAERRALSLANSADYAIDPRVTNLKELVRSLRPNGADVVIDTTGRSAAFAECIDLLRWDGQFLLQGYYPDPITFDFHTTHMKKPRISITCGIGDTDRTLELLRYGRLRWRELVTDLHPVAEAPAVYKRMAAGDPTILGAVFDWR